MSEDQKEERELESQPEQIKDAQMFAAADITMDEFREFLREKQKHACPSCGQRSFGIGGVPTDHAVMIGAYKVDPTGEDKFGVGFTFDTSDLPNGFSPVAQCICGNCGFLSLFYLPIVRKWILKKRAEK